MTRQTDGQLNGQSRQPATPKISAAEADRGWWAGWGGAAHVRTPRTGALPPREVNKERRGLYASRGAGAACVRHGGDGRRGGRGEGGRRCGVCSPESGLYPGLLLVVRCRSTLSAS